MKCRTCRGPAIIDLPRHNANFCAEHFQQLCRRQVEKAIKDFVMIEPGQRVLVAVSGGKDSLALWDLLVQLGYEADGLYIGLGIGDYSDVSADYARAFASERGLHLIEVQLRTDYGYDIPTAAKATRRVPCSACGTRSSIGPRFWIAQTSTAKKLPIQTDRILYRHLAPKFTRKIQVSGTRIGRQQETYQWATPKRLRLHQTA